MIDNDNVYHDDDDYFNSNANSNLKDNSNCFKYLISFNPMNASLSAPISPCLR